jgi:hypothetical protein
MLDARLRPIEFVCGELMRARISSHPRKTARQEAPGHVTEGPVRLRYYPYRPAILPLASP